MIRSSISRIAAIAALAVIMAAVTEGPGLAQTPPYGYIGLYADEARSSNTVSYAGAYTECTMYIFCAPTGRGISAAEFSVAYPANVLPADVTTNPLISVSLGDIDSGVSIAFLDCQNDWVWTHHQRLFLTSADATRIEIEKNAIAGEYQIATCELGYPLEPVFFSSLLCLNAVCPPDIVPPLLQGASNITGSTVVVSFSEPVLKRSAQDPASYEIAEFNDPSVTVPLGEALLLSDGASVMLHTSQPFVTGGRKYVIHAAGVYDAWGNPVPSSSTCEFVTEDHDPPRLASASATSDSLLTVVFNEAVSPATATSPNNYRIYRYGTLVPSYPYRATLVAENQVVLAFNSTNLLPTLVALTVKATNVRDLAGNMISSSYNTASFTVPDTSPPYVAGTQVLGNRLFSVMFNEPVLQSTAETVGNYEIYLASDTLLANPLPLNAAVLQSDKRYVQLTLGTDLVMETLYMLRVHDIEDLHGNRMVFPDVKPFIWPDTYPPVPLTAAALTRSLIRITFNERLDETTAERRGNYLVYETLGGGSIAVSSAELEASADAVRLTLGGLLKYDTGYIVRISSVKDLKGNAIASVSLTTTYPDTFPPMLTGVTTTSASSIALFFDEKLSAAPAVTPSNYVLFETGNPSNVVAVSSATLTGDGSRVQLGLGAYLVVGSSYTISVSNLTDLKGNIIAPGTSLVFIYMDSVPPELLSAYAAVNTAVLASFSEKLDNVTAENTGNYLVFETANPAAAIPVAGAALSGDSSKVLLSLGAALTGNVAYSLQATGVADRAGNASPGGGIVPITRPDTTPPHLSVAEAVTLAYVRITFDEPVTAATAGSAANYVLFPVADPGSTFSPSSVDLPDSRTAGLRFSSDLVSGAAYRVRVSNVADPAGNVIAPGSEETFVCPSIPSGSGYIGLFIDAEHSGIAIDYAGAFMPFNAYVWSHPGNAGMIAAEFSVAFPGNVLFAGFTMNPLVAVSLGDIMQDLSVAFSQCQGEWTWILKSDCYLMNYDESVISFGPAPIFANCSEGYPIESANVLSRIYCNGGGGVATLLQESAASYRGGAVEVTWRLSQIDEGDRFMVLRKEGGTAAYGAPSEDVETNGLSFTYRDESAEPGATYCYRVEYVNGSGIHILFETDPVAVPALPLALSQNWPNPFNPSTSISYYLPDAVRVRLEIFDVAGHLIACLVNGDEERGNHSAMWNGAGESGRPAAAGIYICRLMAGRETLSRKMVLVR